MGEDSTKSRTLPMPRRTRILHGWIEVDVEDEVVGPG
jgi:hypothetical protein